jgi:hypothetical protein
MKRDTYNFEFYPDYDHEHPVRLTFEMEPDLTLDQIEDMCKTFMVALGYSIFDVNETFTQE